MATVNAHYQGTYQPRVPTTGRAFMGGAGRVAHSDGGSQFRPEGRCRCCGLSAGSPPLFLFAYLRATVGLASGSKRAVAASCAKTI
jgi:hypothetical protein